MKSLWEHLQNSRISSAAATADQAQAKSYDLERRVNQLEAENDSLTLILMAMWELFGKSNGLFLKDLEAKMQEIDLRDGKLDGKASGGPRICGECDRPLGDRRQVCVYCGSQVSVTRHRLK